VEAIARLAAASMGKNIINVKRKFTFVVAASTWRDIGSEIGK
jgi:hypothetical protein